MPEITTYMYQVPTTVYYVNNAIPRSTIHPQMLRN